MEESSLPNSGQICTKPGYYTNQPLGLGYKHVDSRWFNEGDIFPLCPCCRGNLDWYDLDCLRNGSLLRRRRIPRNGNP